MILEAAVIVTMMINDETRAPELRLTTTRYVSHEACLEWQKDRRAMPPESVDRVTGRRLIAVYFECQPVDPDMAIDMLSKAKADNGG
jgi:hypothetical protein